MGKLFCLIITSIIFQLNISAQSGWVPQQSGTTEALTGVKFVTKNRGIVISDKNSILRTTNGGKNWELLPAISEKISNLSFRDTNTVFIITTSGTIMRSDDFGLSWIENFTGKNMNFMKISFISEREGILLGYDNNFLTILFTKDGGNSWIESSVGQYNFYPAGLAFLDSNNIMIFDYYGSILHSLDSGNIWKVEKVDSVAGPFSLASLSFANAKVGIVVSNFTITSQKFSAFYKTTNGGLTWIQGYSPNYPGFGTSIDCITADTYSVIFNGEMIKTTNGGKNWLVQSSIASASSPNVCFILYRYCERFCSR